MKQESIELKKEKCMRGSYNEILLNTLNIHTKKRILNLIDEAASANKIDEHGNWDFGAEFDHKGRGSAINWDLYAYGFDHFSKKLLVVIQIRQYVLRKKGYYPQIRKNYYLLGRNEDGHAFAHSIESKVIHSAIKNNKDVILSVQNWIFGHDYKKIIRQGDIALVPVKKVTAHPIEENQYLIEDSHQLIAEKICKNGFIYAKDPTLIHLQAVHPTISGEGWYKVMIANRSSFWKFAAPTID